MDNFQTGQNWGQEESNTSRRVPCLQVRNERDLIPSPTPTNIDNKEPCERAYPLESLPAGYVKGALHVCVFFSAEKEDINNDGQKKKRKPSYKLNNLRQ